LAENSFNVTKVIKPIIIAVVVIIGVLERRVARLERAMKRLRRDEVSARPEPERETTSVEELAERRFNEGIASILGYSFTPATGGKDSMRTSEGDE
jgi:HAMP domain-containing protein